MSNTNEDQLNDLVKRTQDKNWSPLPDELNLLIDSFLPTHPSALRSKGYVALSSVCQHYRTQSSSSDSLPDALAQLISNAFASPVTTRLGDTDETAVLSGLSFFAALFQVEWQAASYILQHDGVVDCIADTLEIFPLSMLVARAVAQLISQAAGHKPCRALIPSQCVDWLQAKSKRTDDSELRAAAAVALVKLSRGAEADAAAIPGGEKAAQLATDGDLVNLMKGLVVSASASSALNDAVEGLAYLSVDSTVKEQLSNDSQFLARLFAVIPIRKASSYSPRADESVSLPIYGTVTIIANICAFRPRLSEEESQIAKLKRIANAAKDRKSTSGLDENPLNDDEHVKQRCKRLIKAGALDALTAAVKFTESRAARLAIAKALLSIVEEQQNRGKVLQAGGSKALITIIHSIFADTPSTSKADNLPSLDRSEIEPIQALAKLCITASPVQVFGPNEGALYDAIRPLAVMLIHPSSNLLQRFEALMALTNLASQSPDAASRVASAEGVLNKAELLMLEDHTLVRRAATELICNLVGGCEEVFNKYGGDKATGSKSKLHVFLALCDVEDTPTRLAASGTLATLTSSPDACEFLFELQKEKGRVLPILGQLVDPTIQPKIFEVEEDEVDEGERTLESDPGLVHRGVVCVRNFLVGVDVKSRKDLAVAAQEVGLTAALVQVFRGSANNPNNPVARPAAEALKAIMETGIPAISKKAGKKASAAPKKGGGPAKVAKADWKEGFKKKQVGVSDMTLLTAITNESINENLQKRWTNGEIYTYIGSVLISVNPFRDLGIYTDEVLHRYKGKNRLEVPPHVFGIAESAYYNMNAYNENQCVIISGESGAGKTEAAKRIMQYIAAVSGGQDSSIQEIKDMVLATNPLLESFGCAKTLRNNNSSRHGKYLEIMFNSHGEPIGAQITNYLLEKGRVVGQVESERNFHIFYQFTKAASPEQREAYGLQGPEAYAYTSVSNCLDVPGIDDAKDFDETIRAMQIIGLSDQEQSDIFRMLAVVLWLGNVQYSEQDDGNADVADSSVTEFAAYLMEVDPALVQKCMTTRHVETQRGGRRGSVYDVPLNPAQASSTRDALAKAVYNNLFEWIVSKINVSMKPRQASEHLIGILDIFGFEIFEDNSFEQLCINYVNEKLQQIFIELTLKTEQEEYVREQIKWTPIKYFNNKIVCDLIEEKRPPGIFAALNDACATAHADPAAADNSFMQRTAALSSNPHFDARGAQFLVKHYAGDVMYNVVGMTDKNKDLLSKDLLDLIGTSGNQFLQGLFPDRPDPNSKKRPPTAGDRIKASAGALVENLMRAQPSYIRTIKPNQNRSGSEYDDKAVLHQIKYLGLQENIRVRRAGFAYRNTFEKMVERFYLLSPNTSYAGEYTWSGDAKSGCEKILTDTGIAKEEWQMGVTKAFIKNPETLFALETMRDRYWHNMAGRIQRAWRNYMRYKHECARRIQRFWKNNKEGLEYAKIRDYGHQILAGRKERRRFSLLGSRRFMGDYLDINGKSAFGSELASAGSITDRVIFSSRCQILVSKFGRSSKPAPRFLVVTSKALYILVLTAKDGIQQISVDRRVNLSSIKSIALSTLRDDWLALNLGPTEEGDPLISCAFKTELITHVLTATSGTIQVIVAPTFVRIEYTKKKEKKDTVKFIKDETVPRNDMYKSHTVHVPSGEPPSSLSRPPPKRKEGVVRPITSGKLLRKGGPDKKSSASRPKPASKPLPGKSTTTAAKPPPASTNSASRPPPAPPRAAVPPPPPPAEPDVELWKAKFAFDGQEGEMSLKKDDIVEVVEKEDNGWWLVKKNGAEGWAPNNYLELVPPKPKTHAAPPPPPPPPPAPAAAKPRVAPAAPTAPTSARPPVAKIVAKSVSADASAKPVAVFPGLTSSNGSATPWKKHAAADTASTDSTPASSRPASTLAGRAPPPPVASKPRPPPPPVGAKPGGHKPPGKPPVPTAARPPAAPAASRPGSVAKPAATSGQMDLAAALAKRAQRIAED
ncbi:P-loop containing nucleoside triphosphate hydrolase protein [Cytidiella melzeri]|nr:P-loop containing nucleoside triphosphate hydrolase protein [Cytidiella melzeri]